MNLREWTVQHVQHQDMVDDALLDYEGTDSHLVFEFEHGTERYALQESLEIVDDADVIVCLNTEDNLETLVENWDAAVSEDPKIIFVNPQVNSKWIVMPSTHDRVADPENLRKGLATLQENTELVENN